MEDRQKLQDEVKRLERELYLKKSKLTSAEAGESGEPSSEGIGKDGKQEEWQKAIAELIHRIGLYSTGGSSTEDIQKERNR